MRIDANKFRPLNSTALYFKEVGIAQSVERRTTGWMAWVRFPPVKDFSPLHSFQTGSGSHPASYPMDIGGSFPGGKAAGT
jgi:hypothetical protein